MGIAQLDILRQQNANCRKCGCFRPQIGYGAINPRAVIILDKPYQPIREMNLLQSILPHPLVQYYLTYYVKCNTSHKNHIKTCQEWLDAELDLLHTKVIMFGKSIKRTGLKYNSLTYYLYRPSLISDLKRELHELL